jgi:hypothetical protein
MVATPCWSEIQILEEVVEQGEAETATSRNEIKSKIEFYCELQQTTV